jgi:DNA-binding beta-propeller fold protein YncE
LATYAEEGSVWVGQRTQLVKFGQTAKGKLIEVARLKGFGEVTSLAIDPLREGGLLLGTDRRNGTVLKYTTEGLLRSVKTKMKRPQAIACDYDKGNCLATDGDSLGRAWISRIDGDTGTITGLPGIATSIVTVQGAWGRSWIAGRDSGYVGRLTGKKLDTLLRGVFRRPSALAFDDSTALLWVADLDSGTVTALDTGCRKVVVLRGFKKPWSIAVKNDHVWVADLGEQSVSRWKSGVLEKKFTGIASPSAVAVDFRDGRNAWVVDETMGRLMRFEGDSLVAQTSGGGLDRPNLLIGHPGNQ